MSCVYPSPQSPVDRAVSCPAPPPRANEYRGGSTTAVCHSRHRTRLYELRLFQHFMIHTGPTLTRNGRDQYLWQTVVPHLATSHDHVMDSVLAIAALHIASENPEQSQSYIDSALDYHTAALTTSREKLSLADPESQDACAICSICILVTATAYSNMSPEKNRKDPLDDILEKRRILRGTRFLLHQLEGTPRHPFLEKWQSGDVEKSSEQKERLEKYCPIFSCYIDLTINAPQI